jgi:hypothetical protein
MEYSMEYPFAYGQLHMEWKARETFPRKPCCELWQVNRGCGMRDRASEIARSPLYVLVETIRETLW